MDIAWKTLLAVACMSLALLFSSSSQFTSGSTTIAEAFNSEAQLTSFPQNTSTLPFLNHQGIGRNFQIADGDRTQVRSGWTGNTSRIWVRDNLQAATAILDSITISGPESGVIGVLYTFTAAISPTDTTFPISYSWKPEPLRGQGTSRATYSWGEVGPKTVQIVATDVTGTPVNDTITITLTLPRLDLESSRATVIAGEPVAFTATVDPLIVPFDYVAFNVGDSSPIIEVALPISRTRQFIATHIYTRTGNYTPTATLVSSVYGGSVTSDTTRLTVQPGPPASVTLDVAASTLPADGSSTTTITATVRDRNGNLIPGENVSFSTAAGSINPSTATTNASGTVTTTLTAADSPTTTTVTALAGSARGVTDVVFTDVPIGDLIATSSSPTLLGRPTTFTATISAGTGVTYTWDFGDGNRSTGRTTNHTYQATGRYTVTVTAVNAVSTKTATTIAIVGNVTPRDGGVIKLREGTTQQITITFLPDVVPDAVVISATLAVSPSAMLPARTLPVRVLQLAAFDPAGAPRNLPLLRPFTIVFSYSDAELEELGVDESALQVFILNDSNQYELAPLGNLTVAAATVRLDPAANTVTLTTTEIDETVLAAAGRNVVTTLYLPSVSQ